MADMATPYLLALAVGIASHVLYWNRFETHMYGVQYIQVGIVSTVSAVVVLNKAYNLDILASIGTTALLALSFLVGAFGSTLVYRAFLNPLNKFPGPWPARISNFYWSSQLGKSDAYYKLNEMHKKYGKFVRIGSNDLSIIDADAVEPSFSAGSKVTKAPWYDGEYPLSSMHTTRSKALHDKRRKVWAPAFSDKALRSYEETVEKYNETLITRLGEFKGGRVNAKKWFNLYSFDVMGSLAFGKEYGMLQSGEKTEELELLSEGMEPLAQMFPMWFMRILFVIPGLIPGYKKFCAFCASELAWRVQRNDASNTGKQQVGTDIMTWILKAYQGNPHAEKDPMLQADAKLIIVAGSDTTAATLTYMFYHLAQEPDVVKNIRSELAPLCQGEWTDKEIKNANYLNGAINEALRLHPPVPSGLRRITPPDGLMVGETFVPGYTEFFMPLYVMGRDESIYPAPESFMPERWFSKPQFIRHKDAFIPFSAGPFGCIGKNLALIELRTLTAGILLKYDVKLAPGEDGKRLLFETKDHFTLALGDLDLEFTPRKK